MNKKPVKKGASKGGNKLTTVLAIVAGLLLVLLIAMILLVPKNQEPAPTEPSMEATTETTAPVTEESTEPEETGPQMLPNMAELYEKNPDVVGWVRIGDTKLNYPVMHTPEDEEKYLFADFEGEVDLSGLPIMDRRCSMDPESQNLIIHGHNMRDGSAFKTLFEYKYTKFLEENPTIYFSTLYEERTYEVAYVFYDQAYPESSKNFKFYEFVNPETEEEFQKGIKHFKELNFMKTGVEVEYGDNLLTLVTCAYHVPNGRFIIVARQVKDNVEITETAGA